MSDFSSVLGKLAGKVMNAANSSEELMCLGKCDKITKHISISYADFMLADSSGGLTDTLSSILTSVRDKKSLKALFFRYSVVSCHLKWSRRVSILRLFWINGLSMSSQRTQ
jgi:hypothetical protein